ncbi:MAG: hypothetical protein ACRYFS_00155 [Janthinobacterium lividum]
MHLHETTSDLRDTDSAGLVDVGIDSMVITVDSKPVSIASDDLDAMANLARLIVLPTGKIEDTQANPAVNADEALAGEDPAHMNALAALGTLPEKPIQVGDKWKSAVILGLSGEKSTADLTLTGWETKDAASVAVIKQIIQGKFATPAGTKAHPSGDMKITGGAAGTRTVRFNVEAGTVESEDSLTYMNVIMTPKAVDEDTPVLPTRVWAKVTSKLTRTAAPAVKPAAAP